MNTRRTFLKTAAAAVVCGKAGERLGRAGLGRETRPRARREGHTRARPQRRGDGIVPEGHQRIRPERLCRAAVDRAGRRLSPRICAALLVGRDVADPETLNFTTLWSQCHPGHPLERYAEGKDPLTGATVWGTRRTTRHTETGWAITALSAIDLALWDLRGKAAGQPVWRLLGATRRRLNAYASMLGYSVKPAEARKTARAFFDQGFTRQKWFFMSGPVDGAEGLKQNIELVRAVREELGPDATLMFDGIQSVWKSVDLQFSIALAKGILPYKPHWLEEPLRPDDLEGYTRLKGETGITLAAGEHWYTRWNVKPFLDRGLVSFVQSDPEWCGGISEWLKICELARQISRSAGDPARASRAGRVELRGVAARDALPDDGVPGPVAGPVPALPDAAPARLGRHLRDGRGSRAGPHARRGEAGAGRLNHLEILMHLLRST